VNNLPKVVAKISDNIAEGMLNLHLKIIIIFVKCSSLA